MIQEAYVSHKVAKLLKEKGFNELCQKEYYANGFLIECAKNYDLYSNTQLGENECSAPTQQRAMRWLRETTNYEPHVWCSSVDEHGKRTYSYEIWNVENTTEKSYQEHNFNFYEEACDSMMEYCLTNLI